MADESLILFSREQQQVLSDLLRSLQQMSGGGDLSVSWTAGGGLSISRGEAAGRSGGVSSPRTVRMRVKEAFNDYLRCRRYDGAKEYQTDIYVAKPYKLRHVAGHYPNVTALTTVAVGEVDVTVSGNSETWELPTEYVYSVDDEIYADRVGATGVQTGGGSPAAVTWIDCNLDGRHWIIKG